jgi:hypothetical protein
MKRAAPAPVEEPVELSSDDSVSSDSDEEAGKGKGENFFRLPNSSKSTEGECFFGDLLILKNRSANGSKLI